MLYTYSTRWKHWKLEVSELTYDGIYIDQQGAAIKPERRMLGHLQPIGRL